MQSVKSYRSRTVKIANIANIENTGHTTVLRFHLMFSKDSANLFDMVDWMYDNRPARVHRNNLREDSYTLTCDRLLSFWSSSAKVQSLALHNAATLSATCSRVRTRKKKLWTTVCSTWKQNQTVRSASHWGRVTLDGVTCPTLANQKLAYGCFLSFGQILIPSFSSKSACGKLWRWIKKEWSPCKSLEVSNQYLDIGIFVAVEMENQTNQSRKRSLQYV